MKNIMAASRVNISVVYIVFVFVILTLGSTVKTFAQQGGVVISANPADEPDASAIIDVKSTDKGALFPRMSEVQRTALSSPATGLLVYQTDAEDGFYYFDGTNWILLNADKTPVGTIVAYGGDLVSIPSGWMLCNGAAISRSTYANLYSALGTGWGIGDGSTTFNIPDLSGRFLRGVNMGSGNDPDAATRTAINGGNSGDNVGSSQEDAFQGHTHQIQATNADGQANGYTNGGWGGGLGWYAIGGTVDAGWGSVRFSSETRPKNANVYYIIKY